MHTLSAASIFLGALPFLAQVNAANSSGCGKNLPAGITTGSGSGVNSLNFTTKDNTQRSYRLYIPSTYSKTTSRPLIYSFHGKGDSNTNQERMSQLTDTTFNANGIAVFPQGTDATWQGDPDAKTDDISFTLELSDYLSQTYCIDNNKWYSTGFSNGGGFTVNILACNSTATAKFAAFAGVASADYEAQTDAPPCNGDTVPIQCAPGRVVPILENHGTSDGQINYTGGPHRGHCLPSIPHFMTAWSVRNGYGSTNKSTSNYDGHADLTRFDYGNGQNVHYRATGLGHQWPNTLNGVGSYNVTKYIMQFFALHSL